MPPLARLFSILPSPVTVPSGPLLTPPTADTSPSFTISSVPVPVPASPIVRTPVLAHNEPSTTTLPADPADRPMRPFVFETVAPSRISSCPVPEEPTAQTLLLCHQVPAPWTITVPLEPPPSP